MHLCNLALVQYSDAVTESALGQRERNRIDTWNAIHDAAYTIAHDAGLAAATTEKIAAEARISRRTFFNYFPTKEDAILGTRVPEVTDAAIQRFRSSDEDELTRVVHLFVAVVRTALPRASTERRQSIVTEYPELRERVMRLIGEVERLVTEVIRDRLEEGEVVDLAALDDADRLKALLMLAGTIAKYAFSRQEGSDAEDPEPVLRDSIAMFRKVIDSTP